MALLESIDIPLGTSMGDFRLPDPQGKIYTLDQSMGNKGLLIVFTCNHCPYAIAIWPRLIKLAAYAKNLGIHTVAINPNINPAYPEDAPEKMVEKIAEWGIPFPYLVDRSQIVANAYQAQCTPDLYLLNKQQQLVYHGRLDDNWKEPQKVTREELKLAIDALANGTNISTEQFPSMGCSIKWNN